VIFGILLIGLSVKQLLSAHHAMKNHSNAISPCQYKLQK